jgi:cytochrome oxidase assembly protein ShyY1
VGVRAVLRVLVVLAATATCIRLGIWQLARLHEKRVLHAAQRALLAEPAFELTQALPDSTPAAGRRVHVHGRWDRSVHVLLSGRTHLGAAGVSLLSPVRLASGEAVLVERGWIPAADGRTGHPEAFPDSDADVMGIALPLAHGAHPVAWARLASDSAGVTLWSARAAERDSVAARIRGPLAPWLLRALPEAARSHARGGEPAPIAEPYQVPDEAMHLSYAIQWFAFAAIISLGSLSLALRRARGARPPGPA